ncbi:MAG: hypothetical protein FWF90_01305 [Promicromonosporaceae bacterium]|nr:hypothetical protein [Promicromonosporaceae bacterium]
MSEDASAAWVAALPHREEAARGAVIERLTSVGLTASDVDAAFTDLGDALCRRAGGAGETEADLRDAVLLVELGAYLAYAQERAAARRRLAYGRLLQRVSVADLAAVLGVSRQAVHKTATSGDSRDTYATTLKRSNLR